MAAHLARAIGGGTTLRGESFLGTWPPSGSFYASFTPDRLVSRRDCQRVAIRD